MKPWSEKLSLVPVYNIVSPNELDVVVTDCLTAVKHTFA